MKHEAELLPAVEVPTHIITEVVFTPDPELSASIDAAMLHQKRSDATKRGWATRREVVRQYQQMCDCTAYRASFMIGQR